MLAAMEELAAYERRLRRAGLPLLIEDYSAWEDVFTRAVPLLSLVVTGQLLGAVDKDWPWWGNALALLGALAIVAGGVAMINRARGRKPLSIPDRVGPMELAAFVLVPALLPLVFGGQVTSALRDRGRQSRAAAAHLRRRRDRPAVDPALDGRPPRQPARRLARAARARSRCC